MWDVTVDNKTKYLHQILVIYEVIWAKLVTRHHLDIKCNGWVVSS